MIFLPLSLNLKPGDRFIFLLVYYIFDAHADMHIRPLTSVVLVAGPRCFSKKPPTPAGNPGAKAAKH